MDDPRRQASNDVKARKSLDELDARIRKARGESGGGHRDRPAPALESNSPLGVAWRLSVELAVAIAVCVGLGWALDKWLGTGPWLLLVFFVLGAAAGMLNVFRAARQINAAADKDADSDTTGAE